MSPDDLAERFDGQRARLRALGYRLLGSLSDADDAVQETWLRLSRTDSAQIENLAAWCTTVLSRVCLNILRSRRQRGEIPLDWQMPDPVVERESHDPEASAVLVDTVGIALLIVLDTLEPDERLAFVLHDTFGLPFTQIAPMIERSPAAARQLASRARRRIRGRVPSDAERPGPSDARRQREIVDAFFLAARSGDLDALVAVLHPEVVFRIDAGRGSPQSVVIVGAATVADQAARFGPHSPPPRPALVNGAPGSIVIVGGVLMSVSAFTLEHGLIVAVDSLSDPTRLRHLSLTLDD